MVEPVLKKVHEDSRGAMYAIELGDRELMLLFSKKGTLRGGHSHDVPEQVMVLTGKMRYHKLSAHGAHALVLGDGGVSGNDAQQVHMGEFLEDTWLIEWKVCKDKHSWSNKDHGPWRVRVQANAAAGYLPPDHIERVPEAHAH